MKIKFYQKLAIGVLAGILVFTPVFSALAIVAVPVIDLRQEKYRDVEQKIEAKLRMMAIPMIRSIILKLAKNQAIKDWPDFVFGEVKKQNQEIAGNYIKAYNDIQGLPANLSKIKNNFENQLYEGSAEKLDKMANKAAANAEEAVNNVLVPKKGGGYESFLNYTKTNDYAVANKIDQAALEAGNQARELQKTIGVAYKGYAGAIKNSKVLTPGSNMADSVSQVLNNTLDDLKYADNCPEAAEAAIDAVDSVSELMGEGILGSATSAVGSGMEAALNSKIGEGVCDLLGQVGL